MKTKVFGLIIIAAALPAFLGAGVFFLLDFIKEGFDLPENFFVALPLSIFLISLSISVYNLIKYLLNEVLTPIINIKNELKKISDGELLCEIPIQGNGEIKALINQLELLRLALLKSISDKNKYEENRKFLLSSISHDLKTPVTSVRGHIEGVLDGVAQTPEKQEKYLKTALAKTDQINFMIDDLLLYSKLDLKQIPFKYTKIEITEYIEQLTKEYEQDFKSSKKEIFFSCEFENGRMVFIDFERFRRAFQNIAGNAKKHILENEGQLRVILREVTASVIIDFSDNGKGISDDDLPYIFDRFYKADISRTSGEGSGLGLAIAKEIIEGQNGKIWATNNKNGIGASIKISLPKI